jgi:hypothetical protein
VKEKALKRLSYSRIGLERGWVSMILRGIIIAKSRECFEEIQEALLKAIEVSELFCEEEKSKQLREARREPKRRS